MVTANGSGVVVPDLRERLSARMRQRGYSGKRLAELSGVSEPNISKILTGRVLHPTSEQITKLAAALDVPTDYLIGADDCPPSEEDLPADLRQRIAALPSWARDRISDIVAQAANLPDTPENRRDFEQTMRVLAAFLESIAREQKPKP